MLGHPGAAIGGDASLINTGGATLAGQRRTQGHDER